MDLQFGGGEGKRREGGNLSDSLEEIEVESTPTLFTCHLVLAGWRMLPEY